MMTLAQSKPSDPLIQALLNAVGPVTTAVIGTLLFGLLVAWVARRAQDRRDSYQLRHDLVSEMTQVARELYFHTQHFGRVQSTGTAKEDAEDELHGVYLKCRIAGDVIESRLRAYFVSDRPRMLWHSVNDLLTVRYFTVLGRQSDELLELNSGPMHSGLDVRELKDKARLLGACRKNLESAIGAVLADQLRAYD